MPKSSFSEQHQENLSRLLACLPSSFLSPLAQKPAPVLDGSGAGLVGNPLGHQITDPCGFWVNACNGQISARRILEERALDFCDTLPATMTGDAWESAARHVLAMRQKAPEPCLFPQPLFKPVQTFAMTGAHHWPFLIRDDFILSGTFCGILDAPDDLPQGSHDSMRFGNEISAFATVCRSRLS